jgi:heme exporter protein B
MTALLAIAGQTARLSLRSGGVLVGLVFFFAVIVVVPFGIGPDLKLLGRIGPAVLWIAALLATLLGLDRLFRDDRDDGSLDLLMLSGVPFELTVLAKCAGAWLATGLPLVIASPVLGLLLGVEPAALLTTAATLLAGTPALILIGAIGAALIAALGRGGLIVAVLVLPFTIPVLIFGDRGPDALPAAVPDPRRADAGQRRRLAARGCGGTEDGQRVATAAPVSRGRGTAARGCRLGC